MNKSNGPLSQVRCFLLDMDGTIYLGEKLLDGSLEFIDLLHRRGFGCLFLTNNSSKDSQQYVEKLARLGLPVSREKIMTSGIATHPDYNCPTETGFMPDIGAMIAFVKASTGREPDLIVGKPNSLLVEYASEWTGIPASAVCMIGDRLYTDIALGAAAGIPTILVLSGETQAHEVSNSPYQPTCVFQDIRVVADRLIHING